MVSDNISLDFIQHTFSFTIPLFRDKVLDMVDISSVLTILYSVYHSEEKRLLRRVEEENEVSERSDVP